MAATAGRVAADWFRGRRLLIVLLIVSAALNLCFVGGAVWLRLNVPPRPTEQMREIAGDLDLNPEQRQAFDRYIRLMRQRGAALRASIDPIISDAWTEIAKPQANQATITRLFESAADMRQAFVREATSNTLVFLASLTPEQRAHFVALLRQHRARWLDR
jgi:uncharacterized membrane protein